MTACLAIGRDVLGTVVAADHPIESQATASDFLAFPKAAPPGASRASGFSKFFENVKPLSDFVGAILDAVSRQIGKLFDFESPLEDAEAASSSEVEDTQGSNFQEEWQGTVFNDPITNGDWAKVIGYKAELESSSLPPEYIQPASRLEKQSVGGAGSNAMRKNWRAIHKPASSNLASRLNRNRINS